MPSAEIITIGTELLLGEIQDTNTRYLTRNLRDHGIDIFRATMVGDNIQRIAQAIQEALHRSDIIITTGGLGPTVDDPTRQAVALAVGVEVEYLPELWEQIEQRFNRFGRKPTENNKRQAWVPKGSIPVENPVGTAPAFIFETGGHSIFSLPGVPREMEYLTQNALIPYLKERFQLRGMIKARVLHISGMGESQVDDLVGDLETLNNPTVGLLAHPGQVDIRITAKADSIEQADQMIADLELIVRQRLGDAIYGVDSETLDSAANDSLLKLGSKLAIVEVGLNSSFTSRIKPELIVDNGIWQEPVPVPHNQLVQMVRDQAKRCQVDTVLGVCLSPAGEKQLLSVVLVTAKGLIEQERSFGSAPALGVPWAVNTALDIFRRNV